MPKDRSKGPPGSTTQPRSVQISKALSWLLRHGATKERVPISSSGYVNLSDVLNWHKLRAMRASFDEVLECIQSNEKQRFGLRWNIADEIADPKEGTDLKVAEAKGETPHQLALAHIEASESPDPADYSIRAVQGHSLKSVDAMSLLRPVTLEDAPETCVHGTFFASWPVILETGGLKAMTRNHVHFATGPVVQDVLPNEEAPSAQSFALKEAMEKSQVVSGMRGDAQVLIYVDIKRSMEEGKMEWWRSDNGVILTEGIVGGESTPPSELEETAMMLGETNVNGEKPVSKIKTRNRRHSQQPVPKTPQKLVPMEYWDMVVGVGIGVLWQRGRGVVQEVPADMMRNGRKSRPNSAHGKPQLKARGKGTDKPKVMIERDDMDGFE